MTTRNIYVALKAFVAEFTDAEPHRIVRGGNNRVPLPPEPPCVVLTVGGDKPLSTTGHRYDPGAGAATATRLMQSRVQIDCYGQPAEEWARRLSLYLSDYAGCEFLAPYGLYPLYPGEPTDMSVVTGENQYLSRWIIEAYVHYPDEHTRPAEFFHGVRNLNRPVA